MESETNNFIIIWLQVIVSLCYCYKVGRIVPEGFLKLLVILPIIFLFISLPLHLHTMHLIGIVGFFISWLTNSKLILFAFGKGPLSNPSLSLKQFIVVASFPIKIHSRNETSTHHKSLLHYTIKSLIFVRVIVVYSFGNYIPLMILYSLYCLYMYLILEIILAMVSVLVQTLLGIHSGPYFNKPYLSSSLQDFWGRRWNLVANNTLRLTVYEPTQRVALRVFGPQLAKLLAIFVTFIVSSLIHELIFYYFGRVRPTWEITHFFLLHGLCILLELCYKKKFTSKFQLPRVVSVPLTLGFIIVTAFWLFFPQLLRCSGEQRVHQEFEVVGGFVKNATHTLTFWLRTITFA